ncbi:MAG: hypothetical protein ACXVCY_15140 [Pseudobdellovibrionaceae bacterium]
MGEENIEPELTVGEIIKVYLSHWRMFLIFTVALFAVAVLAYVIKIPFVASSTIVINDTQNSSLQAFSNQFFGFSKTLQESKKGSSLLSKHIEYLKTREFYEALLTHIQERGESSLITMEERNGYEILKSNYMADLTTAQSKIEFLQRLDKWLKIQSDSDFEIKVSVFTPVKPVSLFLSNTVADLATTTLKNRELDEIARVATFMEQQKKEADENLTSLGKQLADLQVKDENLLPLSSKEKMGDYVSELLVRSNELSLKISENKKMIEFLGRGQIVGQKESNLYGNAGKIEALKIENSLLVEKLSQIRASIDRLRKEAKEFPFATQMIDDLKRKSELEFNRYKELSTALAKLEAQKISIDTRFEVLEIARWENTLPLISLPILGLISLLLSQVVGSIIIYFKYLWNPHVVTAQASRNLVIFDNHATDPRVIFENSKIKLSLKKPDPSKQTEATAEDPQKIAWSVLNKNQETDAPH